MNDILEFDKSQTTEFNGRNYSFIQMLAMARKHFNKTKKSIADYFQVTIVCDPKDKIKKQVLACRLGRESFVTRDIEILRNFIQKEVV